MTTVALIDDEQQQVVQVFVFIRDNLISVLNTDQPERVLPGNFDKVRGFLKDLGHEPWGSFYKAAMRWCDVQQRAARWRQEYIRNGKNTTGRRLAFAAYVKEKNIPPDLTSYSAAQWPGSPDELFCEAFSIWRIDPPALLRHSKDLFTYFEKKLYLTGS